jgi:aminobenzoyl-glutamate utilization protein B
MRQVAGVCVVFLAFAVPGVDGQSMPGEAKEASSDWIDSQADTLRRVNRNIWRYAEPGLEEVRSSRELMDLLEANGFSVEAGVAGMPTAFVASYGSGRPIIGILAEYDALPGLSQDAVPERRERPGVEAGHGCGHSVFGTASTAAAIGIKQAMEANLVSGTVRLYGTPAEETGIGKTYMLRDGYFKEDDVVLAWHAADRTAAAYSYSKAVVSVKYRFTGLAAHASSSPHEGRSALDAVELMNAGVNFMREHIRGDARLHYVITNGGGQPNVVPPETEVWYYIRANKHSDVEEYFQWVHEIAESAAKMTRTTLEEVRVDSDVHELLPNRTLSEVIHSNLELIGPPKFTPEEIAFARQTQEPLGGEFEKALSDTIEPLPDEPRQIPGSTDVGDISWFVPVGQLSAASVTYGAPGHSWQMVACTGMSIGEKGMMVAAKALAATAIDLYEDAVLIARAHADFQEIAEPLTYVTLVPEGQMAPQSIR